MFRNLHEFFDYFTDEQACVNHLKNARWQHEKKCPFCQKSKIYEFQDKKTFKCADCKKRFSIRVGTIFEASPISLKKWFLAIYLVTTHKKGVASTQLAKDLGVTQKTAWFMLHRLRHICKAGAAGLLEGIIEVDETYIGGKEKNKHPSKRTEGTQGRSTKTKSAVIGLLQRGGELRVEHASDVRGKTVRQIVSVNVLTGARVMTDEYRGYKALKEDYQHESVNHSKGLYGKGDVTTNAIEGAFSLLKRGIIGIYHKLSEKHLVRYLDEFSFRYNTRNLDNPSRFNALIGKCESRMRYAELIA